MGRLGSCEWWAAEPNRGHLADTLRKNGASLVGPGLARACVVGMLVGRQHTAGTWGATHRATAQQRFGRHRLLSRAALPPDFTLTLCTACDSIRKSLHRALALDGLLALF